MNKIIPCSIWNLISNSVVRTLNIIAYSFIVTHFFKEDISLSKTEQTLILFLIAIIHIGLKKDYT